MIVISRHELCGALGLGLVACASLFAAAGPARADPATFGPELQGFDYPWPVHDYAFISQGEPLTMRFMDVKPATPNGRVVVALHGKNFCAATWEQTIRALSGAGYRVIAPDQIGFCKSSKPTGYQYSFQQLAANTHALLASIGVQRAIVLGHSTGGMIATRYALMYPGEVDALALVNPIGLEDWKALGVPSLGVDRWTERERATTADGIRAYEKSTYYAGQWKPEYERWVQMLAGLYNGPGHDIVAKKLRLARRHDLHSARRLRIWPDPLANAPADRTKGHDGDRQGRRAARGSRQTRALSGTGEKNPRRDSRRGWSSFPTRVTRRRSRTPRVSTRR
jgi:pimeloyl-ACP methyl ester carboxylesterase